MPTSAITYASSDTCPLSIAVTLQRVRVLLPVTSYNALVLPHTWLITCEEFKGNNHCTRPTPELLQLTYIDLHHGRDAFLYEVFEELQLPAF